jgi:MATE family multidrug resistance protein
VGTRLFYWYDSPDVPATPRPAMTTPRQTLADLLRLAVPVATVQVGLMTMGVVDTVMVGRVSAAALAAVALGNLYFICIAVFGIGVLMALDPVIAQGVGARDDAAVARGLQRGLLVAAGLSVATALVLFPAAPLLTLLHQPPAVVPIAALYARVLIPGIVPFFVFVVFRQTLQAMGLVRSIVVTIVGANLANALLNWVFIYGHLGVPPLGAVGSAWATTLSRWLMALGLLAGGWRALRPLLAPFHAEALALPPLVRLLRIGLPIGLQHELEFGAFGLIAVLMGTLGTVQMAAHQVAINLASLTFMVPVGIGSAAAVLVGRAVGRGDAADARRAALTGLATGVGFMSTSAVAMLALPGLLAGLYTNDPAVLALAASLIPIAGVFQVFDGTQVVAMGTLRGIGDTRGPMLMSLLGFWCVGVPVSVFLGFHAGAGPKGLWWGFVAGLAAVAILLLIRMRHRFRGDLVRVALDDAAEPTG